MTSAVATAIHVLKEWVATQPAAEYYGCAYHDGALSLNTTEAYERMPKKNYIWDPEAWEGAKVIANWFKPGDDSSNELRTLLSEIHRLKTELFPQLADYFDVLYVSGEDSAIGLEKFDLLFSDDKKLGLKFFENIKAGRFEEALDQVPEFKDINWQVDTGEFFKRSLLQLAVEAGPAALAITEALIKSGADLRDGCRWSHDPAVLKVLVAAGAPIDLGYERLIAAASEEHTLPELKFLLEQGADINAQNDDGQTALLRAIGNDNPQVAQYLLTQGARTDLKNKYDETVFEVAESDRMRSVLAPYRNTN